MNKNHQSYLYIFVSALTIGVSSYLYSTNMLVDADNSTMQVANINLKNDNLADIKQASLDTPNVQADANKQVRQVSTITESGQIGDVSYSINDNGTLTLSGGTLKTSDYPFGFPWNHNLTITNVQITGPLKLEGTVAARVLRDMKNLKSIIGIDNIDTSETTNMSSMFSGDSSLTSLDLSKFDTSKTTNMDSMFSGDSSLTRLDVSNFNTTNVTNMSSMFSGDSSLTNLDVSKFNTSNVTNMRAMFAADRSLTNLDVSNFNTVNVTNMGYMFSGDFNLNILDISNFNTSNVIRMEGMFQENRRLWELDVSKFDTAKVIDMNNMFYAVGTLSSLDVSNFNTANVKNMESMFAGVYFVDSLDVSNFNTTNVTNMKEMFAGVSRVTSLDLSNFDTSKVKSTTNMFDRDNRLWILKLGPKVFNSGLNETGLPSHSLTSAIPDSNPVRYATGPGWLAVDANNGGTVDNPQGKTVYDGYLANRPDETETYVWQQKSTLVVKQTVTVEYIDVATGKPVPGVKVKTVSDFQGQPYDVTSTDSRPEISGYTWDGKTPPNAKGVYGDKDIIVQYVYHKNSMPSTPGTSTTLTTPATPSTTSSQPANSSNSSSATSTSASSTNNDVNNVPNYAATKGTVVYSINKIGLYKKTNFSNNNRRSWYAKKPRINRPMFVVTGYARSINGNLRYQVRDVNHSSKTDGQKGYITASRKYIRPVYYATKHSTVTVINPRGVNAYRKADLTGKVKNYRQGTVLRVKGIVKHNLTTRYVLTNGQYVTANRKLVNMGRHKQVKSIKTKRAINRYSNVNFTKKNQSIAKNRTLKVYGYDYSQGHDVSKHGTLRYRVAGGYITANTKYVRAYK